MALLAGTVSFSMAQQGGGQRGGTPEERVQRNLDALKTALSLTADQEAKIKVILLAQNTSMDSLRTSVGQGGDRQAMMEKMMPLRKANEEKVMAVLTDAQKKAYTAYLEQRAQRMQGGQGGGQRGGGGQRPAGQ